MQLNKAASNAIVALRSEQRKPLRLMMFGIKAVLFGGRFLFGGVLDANGFVQANTIRRW